MRNVTISLDEATLKWARVSAAEQDKSLSRFVAEVLARERAKNDDYEAAMRRFFELSNRVELSVEVTSNPRPSPRDEIYDRPVLRRYQSTDLQPRPRDASEAAAGEDVA